MSWASSVASSRRSSSITHCYLPLALNQFKVKCRLRANPVEKAFDGQPFFEKMIHGGFAH